MNKLDKLLIKKNVTAIRNYLGDYPYVEIAEIMENMKVNKKVVLLKSLKTKDQAEVFSFLSNEAQEEVVTTFSNAQVKTLLDSLYTEEAADFIEDLPEELGHKILSKASPEKRKEINKILNYSDDQVGSIMSTDIIFLRKSWSVGQVLEQIKKEIDDIHFARYFYIVDGKGKLDGYVKIKDIIFENKRKSLKQFIKPLRSVSTTTNVEEAANIFSKYGMETLPVVDSKNKLVGMITSEYVIELIKELAREDFQMMAGMQSTEKPYSKSSIVSLFKSRVLWLLLLMISATLSQIVLDAFLNLAQKQLDDVAKIGVAGITSAIVAILPVISGAAGNAGSQSSTTIIRALATGDITNKNYLKVFGKELRVSSLIGFVLAIANFIRLIIYYSVTGDITHAEYIALSGTASLSLMIVIILSQVVGGLLPLIAKIIRIDPAVMAAPLLTTIIDALSTMIFFGISIGIMVIVLV